MAPNPRRRREKEARRRAAPPDPKVAVYARLLHRSSLKRTIQISGDTDALIEYDAGAGGGWDSLAVAVVRVNGTEAVRFTKGIQEVPDGEYGTSHRAVPLGVHRLSFSVPTRHGPVSASVSAEISNSGGFLPRDQIAYLRLTIAGVWLYQEWGGEPVTIPPPSMPIPAAAPTPDADALPRPTDPPDPDASTLPRPVAAQPEEEPESPAPWWRFWKR